MVSSKRKSSESSSLQPVPVRRKGFVLAVAALCLVLGGIPEMNAEEGLKAIVAGEVEKVASGFRFTEGPVWHPEGYLIFSDIPANQIVKWTAPNATETFREPSGQSNGLTFDRQGRLLACEHANRRVSRTQQDGEVVTVVDKYKGKRLNSPNDLVVRSDGTIFFTDPPYGIREPAEKELPFNGVFRISPEGKLTLLVADFERPNGIALSPDEKTLYVADTARGHVRALDVLPDGALKGDRVLCQVPGPDGMKVDMEGNLYVTSAGVAVFDAGGKKIGEIKLPERPANCSFGGADNKTLFVTARTSLYSVKLKVAGLKVGPAAGGK